MKTKTIVNLLLTCFFLLAIHNGVSAQTEDDSQIDQLYEKFRSSFQNQDADLFASLYLEEAQYLIFDGAIGNGRKNFVPSTRSFLDEIKKKGDALDIRFQIEKRFFSDDKTMATDVGYFLFERKGAEEQADVSKMVNVFVKRNGKWRWLVDMSSNAPREMFKSNKTVEKME